jgi:hypothetical protein
MKKNAKTPEQIKEHEELKLLKKRLKSFTTLVGKNIRENGLRKVELELDFFKSRPSTPLPNKHLDHAQTIECMELAIEKHKENN